jgi:beta-lactamase class C
MLQGQPCGRRLLPALGMRSTFINVPVSRMADYAQGYTKEDKAVRMSAGVLSSEAYGIKSTAADMIRYVQANMNLVKIDGRLQRAIANTHKGYFKAGVMTHYIHLTSTLGTAPASQRA